MLEVLEVLEVLVYSYATDGGSLSFNAHSKKADRKMHPTGIPIRTKITIAMIHHRETRVVTT